MSRSRLSAKGPRLAEVCRWANVDDTTRNGWAKIGLVRHVNEDETPDLPAALETVVVARLLERLTPDDALMAWTAVGSTVTALEEAPAQNRLDLLWFPSAPGDWLLATTDGELVSAMQREASPCILVQIGPSIGKAIRSYSLFTKASWRRESSLKAAAGRKGLSRYGPKVRSGH